MPSGVFKPAGSDEPTEAQQDEDVAKGLAYLSSNAAKDPKNDAKTRGWLAKIDKATTPKGKKS